MQFNLSIFTGNKFCLFNYATIASGGYVDFDWFRIFAGTPTGMGPDDDHSLNQMPRDFFLGQNYPNPFNPSTMIKFQIPNSNFVTLEIYNLLGQKEAIVLNEKLNAGVHQVEWNASDFTSGIYFYRLQTRNFADTKKLILIK
jgi:hypothetical protein